MMRIFKNAGIFLTILAFTALPLFAAAQSAANSGVNSGAANSGSNSAPANSGYNSSNSFTLENPLAHGSNLCELLSSVFTVVVEIAIPIAVVFVVLAGLRFIVARGNAEGIKKAKSNLMWTLIGLALFFGAWFLAQVIAQTLAQLGGNGFNSCFLS